MSKHEENNGDLVDTAPQLSGERTTAESTTAVMGSTTLSTDDADIVIGEMKGAHQLDGILTMGANTYKQQDIVEFMMKDEIMASGTVTTADVSAATLRTNTEFVIPKNLLQKTLKKAKALGHLGFRATTVITIKVNCTKFQQGIYKLVWVPAMGGGYYGSARGRTAISHSCTKFQISTLPGVEIDLSCDTSATMKIPFVSVLNSYPMFNLDSTQDGNVGCVFLYPYLPLRAGSSADLFSYTIFAHFEDVELLGPAFTQMSVSVVKRKKGVAPQDQEADGPVSSTLKNVSIASSYVARIPGLSHIFGPVEWATNIAAGVASSFGYSRPQFNKLPDIMIRQFLPSAIHADREDASQVVSMFQQHKVCPVPGFAGSDIDEAAMDFLKVKKGFIKTLQWLDTQVKGTEIWSWAVSPIYIDTTTYSTEMAGVKQTNMPPIAWLGCHFQLWRGSLELTFKLAKTQFHSGRLLVAFFPYYSESGVTLTTDIDDTVFVHRDIIDIREKNEFTIAIPYMYNTQYRNCHTEYNGIGYVNVYVLDELIAPDTVTSTIDINIELAGGPDFEYAGPIAANQLTWSLIPLATATTQMNTQRINVCKATNNNIGRATVQNNDLANASACIGDKVTSIVQFLKQYESLHLNSTPVTSFPVPTFNGLQMPYPQVSWAWDAATILCPSNTLLKFTWFTCPFGIVRGGWRAKIIPWQDSTITTRYGAFRQYQTSGNMGYSYQNGTGFDATVDWVFADANVSGALEIQAPYYSKNPATSVDALQVCADGNNTSVCHGKYEDPTGNPNEVVVNTFDTTQSYKIFRAVADDFQMGLFISIPPFVQKANGPIA